MRENKKTSLRRRHYFSTFVTLVSSSTWRWYRVELLVHFLRILYGYIRRTFFQKLVQKIRFVKKLVKN